jgi:hypothetical protein
MSLANDIEPANTRAKLDELEHRYKELQNDSVEDERIRQVTLRSLKRFIHQFKEEIARYEAHHAIER